MAVRGVRDEEPPRASEGVAVRLSRLMDGYWDDACCSFPAGPVAVLTVGNGKQRGWPPTGAVWAMREARAARRSAWARRASDMDAMVGEEQGGGRQISAHPYLTPQMSDFGFRQTL